MQRTLENLQYAVQGSALTVDSSWILAFASLTTPGVFAGKSNEVPLEGEELEAKKAALLEKPGWGKRLVELLTACVLQTHGLQAAKKKDELPAHASMFVPLSFTDSEAGTPQKPKPPSKKAKLAEAKMEMEDLLQNPPPTSGGKAAKRKAEAWLDRLEAVQATIAEIGEAGPKVQEIWTAEVKTGLKKQRRAAKTLLENFVQRTVAQVLVLEMTTNAKLCGYSVFQVQDQAGGQVMASMKAAFTLKLQSPVLEYAANYSLLHFQFDRFLLRDVMTKGLLAQEDDMSSAAHHAFDGRHWSPGHWKRHHRLLVDVVEQLGVRCTTAPPPMPQPEPFASSCWRGCCQRWKEFNSTTLDRMSTLEIHSVIVANSYLSFNHLACITIASGMAAIGLITDSSVFVLAAFFVSPLMQMVLATVWGLTVQDLALAWRGVRNMFIGAMICLALGAIFGLILGVSCGEKDLISPIGDFRGSTSFISINTLQITSRGPPAGNVLMSAIVAALSGMAVALGQGSGISSALIGVCISTSLLPPLVNAGMMWTLQTSFPKLHNKGGYFLSERFPLALDTPPHARGLVSNMSFRATAYALQQPQDEAGVTAISAALLIQVTDCPKVYPVVDYLAQCRDLCKELEAEVCKLQTHGAARKFLREDVAPAGQTDSARLASDPYDRLHKDHCYTKFNGQSYTGEVAVWRYPAHSVTEAQLMVADRPLQGMLLHDNTIVLSCRGYVKEDMAGGDLDGDDVFFSFWLKLIQLLRATKDVAAAVPVQELEKEVLGGLEQPKTPFRADDSAARSSGAEFECVFKECVHEICVVSALGIRGVELMDYTCCLSTMPIRGIAAILSERCVSRAVGEGTLESRLIPPLAEVILSLSARVWARIGEFSVYLYLSNIVCIVAFSWAAFKFKHIGGRTLRPMARATDLQEEADPAQIAPRVLRTFSRDMSARGAGSQTQLL
ncbi:unnamed protein product [Symbiodinium sp. KB8]|nr:unnamed protein product [Symbiodinium sp. KB8]